MLLVHHKAITLSKYWGGAKMMESTTGCVLIHGAPPGEWGGFLKYEEEKTNVESKAA